MTTTWSSTEVRPRRFVVHRPRAKNFLFPPAVDGVERLDVINVLGVLVDSTLSFPCAGWLTRWAKCSHALCPQNTEAPWIVWASALECRNCYVVIPPLVCISCVVGMVDAGGNRDFNRCLTSCEAGFLPKDQASLELLCDSADMKLFASILRNPHHVLHQFLPPVKHTTHNLRSRAHNRVLPNVKRFHVS